MTRERPRGPRPAAEPETPAFTKLNALSDAVTAQFGENIFAQASRAARNTTHLDTGIMSLDIATHGGIAEDAVTMLVGWESSGKTTLAQRIAASAQRKYPDRAVLWMDAEQTFDMVWGQKSGMVAERTFVSRPPKAEMIVDIVDSAMATGEASLVVIDSLPAMTPQSTLDGSAFDKQVADRARLIGVMCSKIIGRLSESIASRRPVTVLFINQWRSVIGGYSKGPTKTMPGGNQPRFLASTIIEMVNSETVGQSEDKVLSLVKENKHTFKVRKNKTGNSLREGEFLLVRDPSDPRGEGSIDDYVTTLTFAKRFDLWKGGGTRQYIEGLECMDGEVFRNGAEGVAFFREHPDHYDLLKQEILRRHRVRSGMPGIPRDGYLIRRT